MALQTKARGRKLGRVRRMSAPQMTFSSIFFAPVSHHHHRRRRHHHHQHHHPLTADLVHQTLSTNVMILFGRQIGFTTEGSTFSIPLQKGTTIIYCCPFCCDGRMSFSKSALFTWLTRFLGSRTSHLDQENSVSSKVLSFWRGLVFHNLGIDLRIMPKVQSCVPSVGVQELVKSSN